MLPYLLIVAIASDPFHGQPMCPMDWTLPFSSQLLSTSCQTIPGGGRTPCGGDCAKVDGATCCSLKTTVNGDASSSPAGCCLPGTTCCGTGWRCVFPPNGGEICTDDDYGCCPEDQDCCYGLGCSPKGDPNHQCCVGTNQFGRLFCEDGSSCCGSGDNWLCCNSKSESCCGSTSCCKSDELCCGSSCCTSGQECCDGTCCEEGSCCGGKCCPNGYSCTANKQCMPETCIYNVGGKKFDLWPLSSQYKGNDTVVPDYKLEINPCGPLIGNRSEFCYSDSSICFEYELIVGRWPPRKVALNGSSLELAFEATTSWTDYVNITFYCASVEKVKCFGNDYDTYWVQWYHPALCGSNKDGAQQQNLFSKKYLY